MKTSVLWLLIFIVVVLESNLAQENYLDTGNNNPLFPGYFADPTIKKYGDNYYLYTTTDGIKLASGEPQVWVSKDFKNWFNYEMDIDVPEGLTNVWAPDAFQGTDERYYFFMGNCQFGCNIYGYVSDDPVGPWKPVNEGKPVIEVGTGIDNLPALDAQYLIDDDGSIYAYFGTWCSSFGGMGWARIDPDDHHTILESGGIPLSEVPNAFEAAYPFKHNDQYYLMYSSGDCRLSSYAVHYSVSDSPTGPFSYGENSPILASSEDGTIDSPGHHSVLKTESGDHYILYHRHDNPHSTGGMFRQVCADSLNLSDDGSFLPVNATHEGIDLKVDGDVPANLAVNSSTSATSYYHLVSGETRFSNGDIDYEYKPDFAVDENNGTMWKAGNNQLPQSLTLDLGEVRNIKRVMTFFEYPTFYYQYKIEYSEDSLEWEIFTDKRDNRRSGAPMIDDASVDARYVRITVTGTEKAGLFAAIWDIKIFDTLFDIPEYQNPIIKERPGKTGKGEMLVEFDPDNLDYGEIASSVPNSGTLGGEFTNRGELEVQDVEGFKAAYFDGSSYLELSKKAPGSLAWNSSFAVSAWVFNPEIESGECLVSWNSRENMLQGSYAALMYGDGPYGAVAHGDGYVDLAYQTPPEANSWNHIVLTFDGMKEEIYVNGVRKEEQPISLFVENGSVMIGYSGQREENYTGYMANVRLYDRPFSKTEIDKLMRETHPSGDSGEEEGID